MTPLASKSLRFLACFLSLLAWSCSDDGKTDQLAAQQPNVLLVVVDTLRADHLSPYGYSVNPTTPNLQKLVDHEQMMVLSNVLAPSSWTKPSMATLFTGLDPVDHGVMRLIGPGSKLQDSHTLAQEFAAAGYDTGCVMSNFLLTTRTGSGFEAGFHFYDDSTGRKAQPHRGSTAAQVTDSGIQWLTERDPNKPWLLVLHYFDPHASFEDHSDVDWMPKDYRGWVQGGVSTDVLRQREADCSLADQAALAGFYDEEIHAVDAQLQRVVSYLQESEQWQETVLVFTADHGEELGERGHIGHTQTLFPELVEIPLLVRVPQAWSASWQLPTAPGGGNVLVQLYAAMLGVAGIEVPAGRRPRVPPYLYSEVDFQPIRKEHLEKFVQKRLVRQGDFTLIQDRRSGTVELFNHHEDPQMLVPLLSEHSQWGLMKQLLEQHRWWEAR